MGVSTAELIDLGVPIRWINCTDLSDERKAARCVNGSAASRSHPLIRAIGST
jgi:hypothetical protein